MTPFFARTALAAVVFMLSACGATQTQPIAQPPPAPAPDPRSEVAPERTREQPPPDLIAPPPAYGNKVVMAGGDRAVSVQ